MNQSKLVMSTLDVGFSATEVTLVALDEAPGVLPLSSLSNPPRSVFASVFALLLLRTRVELRVSTFVLLHVAHV